MIMATRSASTAANLFRGDWPLECCSAADEETNDIGHSAVSESKHQQQQRAATFPEGEGPEQSATYHLDRSYSIMMSHQEPTNTGNTSSSSVANPYHVLQIRRDATLVEIRQAYRRLALWHHPGRCCGGTSSIQERQRRLHVFTLVAASYETLADPSTRGRCDALLRQEYHHAQRSDLLPAGQVHVGGKPVFAGQGGIEQSPALSQQNNNRHNDLVARVMEHFHGEGGMAGVLPTVTPVSSDSSVDESLLLRHNHEDDDDEFDDDDDSTIDRPLHYSLTPNAASTRIHYPLGTPIGTPQHRLAQATHHDNDDMLVQGARSSSSAKKNQPHNFFRCGVVQSLTSSFDTQPLVINQSDSTTTEGLVSPQSYKRIPSSSNNKGEIHYTVGDTNRLFGGPLQLMFRARRWKSFQDPYQVFRTVFGTEVCFGQSPVAAVDAPLLDNKQPGSPNDPKTTEHHHPHMAEWSGTSETLYDGTIVFTTSRTLQDRKLTRTETVWVDPATQMRHSKVHVTSEILSVAEDSAPETTDSGWSVSAFFAELLDPCVEEEGNCRPPDASCGTCTANTTSSTDQDLDVQSTDEKELEEATLTQEESSEDPFCGAACAWFD